MGATIAHSTGRLFSRQLARFENRLRQLLDKQRHTVGLGQDLLEQRPGNALPPASAETIAALCVRVSLDRFDATTCPCPDQRD
jgi:hypothetical protein